MNTSLSGAEDFGGAAYAKRRAKAIDEWFSGLLARERRGLLFAFDVAVEGSYGLRQYLWAHSDRDLERARKLIEVLEPAQIRVCLRYLLEGYWTNLLGWPDLGLPFRIVKIHRKVAANGRVSS